MSIPQIEIEIVDKALQIRVPLDLLEFASERAAFIHTVCDNEAAPPERRFKITNVETFAQHLGTQLLEDHGEEGDAILFEALDDAAERVVDLAMASGTDAGFTWKAAGHG